MSIIKNQMAILRYGPFGFSRQTTKCTNTAKVRHQSFKRDLLYNIGKLHLTPLPDKQWASNHSVSHVCVLYKQNWPISPEITHNCRVLQRDQIRPFTQPAGFKVHITNSICSVPFSISRPKHLLLLIAASELWKLAVNLREIVWTFIVSLLVVLLSKVLWNEWMPGVFLQCRAFNWWCSIWTKAWKAGPRHLGCNTQ